MSGSDETRRRRIEREFGVPIAGEILDDKLWTHTSIKKLPEGLLDQAEIFGRTAPLVIDLGCGNGRYLLSSSVWRTTHDHIGCDSLPVVIRYATRRANQRGLTNVRFAVCGGLELLKTHIAPASVAEIHCYHPQPYYEPSEVHKRLVTPEFLALVHRALAPDGQFFLQTDNPGYWKYMKSVVPVFFNFEEHRSTWLEAPKGRTRREILALKRGLPVSRGVGRPKQNLTPAAAIKLAETLPPPTFDADRRLHELDRLERE